MAARIPARLTASEGRRFGLTVGGAFLILAALSRWRGHPLTSAVFIAAGAPLAVAALAIPTWLGPVEATWMRMAQAISRVTTPIVMGIIYFLVVTPVGLLRCALGGNPLRHAEAQESFWKGRSKMAANMERQF